LQIPSIGKSIGCLKKKLLVLDVNGLLADIVSHPYPKNIKRDAMIVKKAGEKLLCYFYFFFSMSYVFFVNWILFHFSIQKAIL